MTQRTESGHRAIGGGDGWDGVEHWGDCDAVFQFDVELEFPVGISSGSYDGAGNQTVANGDTLTYDAESRIRQVVDASVTENILYDGNGSRIEKSVVSGNSTLYVYDAYGVLAAEYSTAAAGTYPCTTCYVSMDQIGTTRLVTGSTGAVVARHDFLPFGEEITTTGGRTSQWGSTTDVEQKFTGQLRDTESALDFFNARYYGYALNRFTSPDPANAGADPSNPQSWNGYAYVMDNPLSNVDPSGLAEQCLDGSYADACVVGTPDPVPTDPGCVALGTEGCIPPPLQNIPPPPNPSNPGGGGGNGPGPINVVYTPQKTVTQPCVAPNLLQRAGIAVQARLANFFNKTIAIGAGGSVGAGNKVGVSISVSRQLAVASNGQAAFATTVTTFNGQIFNSATTAGYGGYGGIQFSLSNTHNVNDLGGSSLDYGFGGGEGLGAGFDFSTNLQTWQATGTLGGGFGGYGHGLTNVTTSITPICGG